MANAMHPEDWKPIDYFLATFGTGAFIALCLLALYGG